MALHRGRRGFSVHPSTPPTHSATDTQSRLSPIQVGGNVNNSSSSGGRKRGRGPTRGLDLLMMAPDKRIVVEFNKQGQAIGEYASNFANLCGVTVRNPSLAPLQVEKWDDIRDHAKEMMWKNIQEYVDVGDKKSK